MQTNSLYADYSSKQQGEYIMVGKYVWKTVLACTFTSAVLVGCGSGDGKDSSDADINLEIYQPKVEIKDALEDLVETYEEEHPEVGIDVTTVGGGADSSGDLKTKFASGDAPDIYAVGGPSGKEQYKDNLADLSDMELVDLALDGTLTSMEEGDEILGVPMNQEGYGFVYNKSVFEKAGINPEEITDYDSLEDAVEELDNQKDELGIEGVFAYPAKEKWVIGNHTLNPYLSSEFDDDVKEVFESDSIDFEKSDEIKQMVDLQYDYSVQPALSLDYSQQVEEYFSLERVAMIQQGNWVYPTIEEMDPEFAEENIGIIPIPVEGAEGKMPVGVSNHWGVNGDKDEETVQASKDFLDWMYTSDEGKEAVVNNFKFVPAYEGFDGEDINDTLSQTVYDYAMEGNTLEWSFLGYPDGWEDTFGANVQKYLSDKISWDEVIDESRTAWEDARE